MISHSDSSHADNSAAARYANENIGGDIMAGGGAADYFALLKPRVMSLVIFTALVGIVIAPSTIHPLLAIFALLTISVGAGAAGALNMWYEARLDARMERTKQRPLPAGRIASSDALAFALILSTASVVFLGLLLNWLAAALLAFTIFFYVVIYTIWLKPRTSANIVIGGFAGALPPLIGWSSVTGTIAIEPLILVAIIFMWTPPHFWALALLSSDDYRQADLPMLPLTAGAEATCRQIMMYCLLLLPLGLAPWWMGFAGAFYAVAATLFGGVLLLLALRLYRAIRTDHWRVWAGRLFAFSIFYLFSLFAILLVEHVAGIYMPSI